MRGLQSKVDMAYTIGVLECSNDIIVDILAFAKVIVNGYGKGWIDTLGQIFPDRSSQFACTTKLEMQTAR